MIETTNGFYYPVSTWGTNKSEIALQEAKAKFEELKKVEPYVRVVESHHPYSTGYWVELKNVEIAAPQYDFIIEEYTI